MKCIQDLFEIIVMQESERERGEIERLSVDNFNLVNEIEKLQDETFGLSYGKFTKPAFYIKNGKVHLTPSVLEVC